MMVTFVAQCEKKALNKTRRVLDAFANRIGSRTWQTVITSQGLEAVKKLLRKSASKNTAVSCHWIRSRSRSELIWIVGNRSKFNSEGYVPVNLTQKNILNTQWEDDWHYLPLIKSLTALAGLFHDWGKSSALFQTKLENKKTIADPVRHEWVSVLFINTYVNNEKTDKEWLTRLAEGQISAETLKSQKNEQSPLQGMPLAASLISWLVLSHHRLPLHTGPYRGKPLKDQNILFQAITQEWGYENRFDDFTENLKLCFEYPEGLPCESEKWLRYARRSAKKLLDCMGLLDKALNDGSLRLILHHCRLALMLGDYHHSSLDHDKQWKTNLNLYANTYKETGGLKQKLDEHLLGVAKQAIHNAHLLPAFEGKHAELQKVYDVRRLKQKSPLEFHWQDIAVARIKAWRKEQGKNLDSSHFGFFSVNMASTGKGKTFANAKIMRALSVDEESLRYILALGLRTLTLQTGDEYRHRIGLNDDELAVLIGSGAVLGLHNKNRQKQMEEESYLTGSESEQSLLDNELVFDSEIPEKDLKTVLKDKKHRQFLYAPVLSCTIDHLMAATETKRGGRYILPSLRLMSSDLVIDEIDDFNGDDLIAIGRLIHLAGMLGRKVMISSATIPPDLAEGYFNAYQAGWSLFAQMRGRSQAIGCSWIDEFATRVYTVDCTQKDNGKKDYQHQHSAFVSRRIKNLQDETPKRRASICPCEPLDNDDEKISRSFFYDTIQTAVLEKHHHHHGIDQKTDKRVSFGVVRFANITPCLEFTRHLLNTQLTDDVKIRTMAYHSQQILIMRSEQEKHLDAVLKRSADGQSSFDNEIIRQHLDTISAKNVIFILVATPVEEVGRDHDFDWAVIEPSSFRSFIQLAGRILRHRKFTGELSTPNMAILQYNLKGFLKKSNEVFCRPGYESEHNPLDTHDLFKLVDVKALKRAVDAAPRISKRKTLNPRTDLIDLEHEVTHQLLTDYERQGPESLEGWLTGWWWLTAIPQELVRFRAGFPQRLVYLVPEDNDTWKFVEKDKDGKPKGIEENYGIRWANELTEPERHRLWLRRDYKFLLEKLERPTLKNAALIYGEIGLPVYGKDLNNLSFSYSHQLGLVAT